MIRKRFFFFTEAQHQVLKNVAQGKLFLLSSPRCLNKEKNIY